MKHLSGQENFTKEHQKINGTVFSYYDLTRRHTRLSPKNVDTKRSISNVLAERAGKATNTIYKNINELEIYNAISLLRYWQAMAEICREFKIDETKIPNLNALLLDYEEILSFLNHITTEDQIETLIDNNFNATLQIITFYKSHGTSITEPETKAAPAIRSISCNKTRA